MSATEVIEEIKKLPTEERQKVLEYLWTESGDKKKTAQPDEDFKRLADEMFQSNDELFRKLAQ